MRRSRYNIGFALIVCGVMATNRAITLCTVVVVGGLRELSEAEREIEFSTSIALWRALPRHRSLQQRSPSAMHDEYGDAATGRRDAICGACSDAEGARMTAARGILVTEGSPEGRSERSKSNIGGRARVSRILNNASRSGERSYRSVASERTESDPAHPPPRSRRAAAGSCRSGRTHRRWRRAGSTTR
jgi:hypothetical protein